LAVPADILDLNSRLTAWLFDHALPLWWEVGFDRDKGGCFEKIGQDGKAIEGPRRARVAARQAWVYAEAGKLGWTGPWREARDHALEALTTTFARDDGLFRILAAADGTALDESANPYEQAFALLALSSAGRELEAIRTREAMITAGLLRADGGVLDDGLLRANPMMHLFEAVQAWDAVGVDLGWRKVADAIAATARARLIDPRTGALIELFDTDWGPLPDADWRTCSVSRPRASTSCARSSPSASQAGDALFRRQGLGGAAAPGRERKAFYPAPPPFPLLHVDTTWKFRAMYEPCATGWRREEPAWTCWCTSTPKAWPRASTPSTMARRPHRHVKTEGLKQALDKYGFDAAFGGARRDEEKSRAKERIFSFRTAQHRWDPKNQRPELWNLYNARKNKGESSACSRSPTGPSSTSGSTSTSRTSRSCRCTSRGATAGGRARRHADHGRRRPHAAAAGRGSR
jgi:hypothetical protein